MADAFFRDTGAANRNSMWGMLKQRERIRSTLQRVPPDVSVSLRDGCAFVSDQRHDNGVRNASILEQANPRCAATSGSSIRIPGVCLHVLCHASCETVADGVRR